MLKLLAPKGMVSFTHAGHPFDIASDGSVMIDDRHEADFASHGFTRFDAPKSDAASADADPRRAALFDRINAMPTDDIEAMLEMAGEASQVVPENPDEVKAEDVAAMNRPQLFEFLKSRGVSVAPPITNDRLREIAVEHMAKPVE